MTALVRSAAAAATAAALAAGTPALAAGKALAPGETVDLNRATVAELMHLPGVGEQKARRVVEYRQKRPFRRPEEILHVKGFGKTWLQRVRGHLAAAGPAPAAAPAAAPPALPRK